MLLLPADIARVVLASTLLLAAVTKLRAPSAMSSVLAAAGLKWSSPQVVTLAIAIGVFETAIALALVLGAGGMLPALCALFALVGFTGVILILRARGYSGPCGCFGSASSTSNGWLEVLRNMILIVSAVMCLLPEIQQCAVMPLWNVSREALAASIVVGGTLFLSFSLLSQVMTIPRQFAGKRGTF